MKDRVLFTGPNALIDAESALADAGLQRNARKESKWNSAKTERTFFYEAPGDFRLEVTAVELQDGSVAVKGQAFEKKSAPVLKTKMAAINECAGACRLRDAAAAKAFDLSEFEIDWFDGLPEEIDRRAARRAYTRYQEVAFQRITAPITLASVVDQKSFDLAYANDPVFRAKFDQVAKERIRVARRAAILAVTGPKVEIEPATLKPFVPPDVKAKVNAILEPMRVITKMANLPGEMRGALNEYIATAEKAAGIATTASIAPSRFNLRGRKSVKSPARIALEKELPGFLTE